MSDEKETNELIRAYLSELHNMELTEVTASSLKASQEDIDGPFTDAGTLKELLSNTEIGLN